ncbi:MAG: hypothetical protein QME48_05675 [bacterium]|nr:hypothetical protein [bacterium]
MKKFFLLVIFLPLFIFSFKKDTYMFSGDSYERYPYFLDKKSIATLFDFENFYENREVLYKKDFVLNKPFYDFQITHTYTRKDFPFLIYEFRNPSPLNYDVNLISDKFSTLIYSSLSKNDSSKFFKGFSNFQINSGNLYKYDNQLIFNYRFLNTEVTLNDFEKSFLLGYQTAFLSSRIGYDLSKILLSKIFLYGKNFYLYSCEKFHTSDKSFEHFLYTKYFGNFLLTNYNFELLYDSTLNITTGVLQRILPQFSVYGNTDFSYPQKDLFFNFGLRFIEKNLYVDFMPFYRNKLNYNLSFLLESKFLDIHSKVEKDTTINYDFSGRLKGYFFKNNLESSLTVNYNSLEEVETIVNFKIVNGSCFIGSKFFLEEKEYLIKGGFYWKFLD